MRKKVLVLFGAALVVTALLAGCAGIKEADVPYASDMVDNMMAGMNDNDYAVFSRDFSEVMKEAIDETAFAPMTEQLSVIGAYESKSFYQAADTTQNDVDMTVVVYKAKFSGEDADVLITVSFSGEKGEEKIEGVFFNSPKLRGE